MWRFEMLKTSFQSIYLIVDMTLKSAVLHLRLIDNYTRLKQILSIGVITNRERVTAFEHDSRSR